MGKGLRSFRDVQQPPATGQLLYHSHQLLLQVPAHDCDDVGGMVLPAVAFRLYRLLFRLATCLHCRFQLAGHHEDGVTPAA